MKKTKYILLLTLSALSFYITDKVLIFIDEQKPLMKEIKLNASKYETAPVNSVIENNTIIPGLNGKEIDYKKSLVKMEDFNAFNENFLKFNDITPEISLEDNKDKIIIKGNPKKRSVSLILEQDKEKEEYLENYNIKYDILSSLDTDFTKEREYLNSYKDKENYDALETILKKHKINSHICTTMHNDYDHCLKKEHYIVLLTNENLLVNEIINKISSGSIIYIPKTMKLVNLKLIISEIERQDLKIIYLSTLISEKIW